MENTLSNQKNSSQIHFQSEKAEVVHKNGKMQTWVIRGVDKTVEMTLEEQIGRSTPAWARLTVFTCSEGVCLVKAYFPDKLLRKVFP